MLQDFVHIGESAMNNTVYYKVQGCAHSVY